MLNHTQLAHRVNAAALVNYFARSIVYQIIFFLVLMTCGKVGAQASSFVSFADYLGENSFEGSVVETSAYRVDSIISEVSPNVIFKSGFVNLLPLSQYYLPDDGVDYLYQSELAGIKLDFDCYFAVFQYPANDSPLTYRLELKIPQRIASGELTAVEKTAIHEAVVAVFDEQINGSVEKAVDRSLSLLFRYLSGAEPINVEYDNLGFTKLRFESDDFPELQINDGSLEEEYISAGIYDFSELNVNEERISFPLLTQMGDIPFSQSFVYITSNLTTSSRESFELAATTFGSEQEKMSLWLHVDYESATEYTLYAKVNTNLSQEEAKSYLVSSLNERFDNNPEAQALLDSSNNELEKSESQNECQGFYDANSLTSITNILNIEHGKNFSFYCLWANGGFQEEPWQNAGTVYQYHFGIMAGVLDGLFGTVSALMLLSEGIGGVKKNTPLTWSFWGDLIKKAFDERSLSKAWDMKKEEAKAFYNTAYEFLKIAAGEWRKLANAMWLEIEKFVSHLNPLTGLFSTGHAIGLVVFEVLIEVLTAGSASVLSMGKKIVNLGKGTLKLLGKPKTWPGHIRAIQEGFSDAVKLSRRTLATLSHIGQCFIAGTLVSIPSISGQEIVSSVPIEALEPFELVLSYDDGRSTNDNYDLSSLYAGVSIEQASLDLIGANSSISWAIGGFDGDGIRMQLVRPVSWFQERGLVQLGRIAQISIPELGLDNEFRLVTYRLASLDERKLLSLDGNSQPIVGIVERSTPLALQLIVDQDTIGVTPEHRIFSVDRNNYVEAGKLQVGERLKRLVDTACVLSVDALAESPRKVYNIEVYKNHNYYVGKNGLLVHNKYSIAYINRLRYAYRSVGETIVRRGDGSIDDFGTLLINMPKERLAKFYAELGVTLRKTIENSNKIKLVKAWEALINNPLIRKDVASLASVNRILNNSAIVTVISKADLQTVVQKLAQKGVRCRTCPNGNPAYKYLDEVLDDIEHGATKFGSSYSSVVTGFKQGGNFAEGSLYVADAVKRFGNDFPPNTLFEFTEVTTSGVRRVDVKVNNGFNGKDIFFEFKSVQRVPPSGFANQFIKDLDLAAVDNLGQIKWWFDGKKVSSLPKQQFLDALDGATIPQNVIDKLVQTGPKTKHALLDMIDDDFDLIFSIK